MIEQRNPSRRDLLTRAATAAGAVGVGLAGCLSGTGTREGAPGGRGYAAFFTLWDWAEQVAGDDLSFENPVPVGRMGHGWEPPGDVVAEIASTSAFIYLDTPEFRWAQDVAAELATEHESVTLIDGMRAIPRSELLGFDGGHGHGHEDDGHGYGHEDDGHGHDDHGTDDHAHDDLDRRHGHGHDLSVAEFALVDARTGDVVAWWHVDHWDGGIPDVPLDGHVPLSVVVENADDEEVPLGDDEPFRVHARTADGEQVDAVVVESHGNRVDLHGRHEGRTSLVFELRHDDEVVFDTAADGAAVSVVPPEAADTAAFFDPHVWVDPVLARYVVDGIAEGLANVDPSAAERFRENAARYGERLDDVHRRFVELADRADRDVVVFAGHDSFRYLEARYGFEIRTPTGVTPDAVESLSDVAGLARTIDEHGIDTVLYDPFAAPSPGRTLPAAVEVLLENSGADRYAPLTPAEGITTEWAENGYGWVEQMTEINLPSLEQALVDE